MKPAHRHEASWHLTMNNDLLDFLAILKRNEIDVFDGEKIRGWCYAISIHLVRFLRGRNHVAHLYESNKHAIAVACVQHKLIGIDMTARQFDPACDVPLFINQDRLHSEFQQSILDDSLLCGFSEADVASIGCATNQSAHSGALA